MVMEMEMGMEQVAIGGMMVALMTDAHHKTIDIIGGKRMRIIHVTHYEDDYRLSCAR
jgi:hypothetical protein